MPLTLLLNGEDRTFLLAEPSTLELIVASLCLKVDRVAIEHNGTIAPRADWPSISVRSGDRLELVHFVGGGLPVSSSSNRSH